MKRVYVSLPISNREDTVYARYNEALRKLYEMSFNDDIEIHAATDIHEFDENGPTVEHKEDWNYYMAQDIPELLMCDTIFMCDDWEKSKGCKVELAIAKELNYEIIYESTYDEYHKCKN